jgi:hypothetical protein
MFYVRQIAAASLFALCLILTQSSQTFAGDNNWKPVNPAELAMKEPMVEKDADAEALLWEVYVADEIEGDSPRTVLRHYLRIKIFNERGREQFNKIDIPFGRISGYGVNIKIKDIAARTIKADGSIVELKPEDVIEREVVKGDGIKLKAKSFAVPSIEPGAIIEYRWKEIRGDNLTFYDRLQFAREIPVHQVIYYLKPLSLPGFPYGMRAQNFNGRNTPFNKEKNGFYSTMMTNVPSFKEEPHMPSEYAVRPWMLVYYSEDKKLEPQKFWREHGRTVYENNKTGIKVGDDVRTAVSQAVGDATTTEQKVERIFNFVRTKIKNVYDDINKFSDADRKKVAENKTPAGTLKLGFGDPTDINRLFVAMLTAAGVEARIANLPRRNSSGGFNINFTDAYFMQTTNVAVKIGDKWQFFDPAVRYLPYGMLWWDEEGQPALISDPKEPVWAETPVSTTEKSLEKRTGKFKLTEEGTLEGEVRMEFTGHIGAMHKEYNDEETEQERVEIVKNLVRANVLGSAEVSDVKVENVLDPDKPFVYAFKVKVPGFATRTGKRIFLQPNFFERSAKPVFETNARRYDVEFRYPYAERDEITIELPAGYELESPDAPATVADGQKIGLNEIKMFVSNDKRTLTYKRNFYFGNGGFLRFPQTSYPILKQLFEAFHKANTHALTLKQGAPTAAVGAPQPPQPPAPVRTN